MNKNSGTTKLILIGVAAVFLYAELGPIGLIALGVAMMLFS